jgi:hypothetical protein
MDVSVNKGTLFIPNIQKNLLQFVFLSQERIRKADSFRSKEKNYEW